MDGVAPDFFFLPPPFNMVVLLMLIPVLGGVITAVLKEVRRHADRRADHQMKLELMQSGLSPEEAREWLELPTKPRKPARAPRDQSVEVAPHAP